MRDIVARYERETQPAIYMTGNPSEPSIEGDVREQMMKYRNAKPEIRGDHVVVSLYYQQGDALPGVAVVVHTKVFFGDSPTVLEPEARMLCRTLEKQAPKLPVTNYTIGIGFADTRKNRRP